MTNAQINVAIYHVMGKDLDYVGSLDAMHEAEKVLTPEQQRQYLRELYFVVVEREAEQAGVGIDVLCNQDEMIWVATATAPQRAEAFLRTLNLWDDTK